MDIWTLYDYYKTTMQGVTLLMCLMRIFIKVQCGEKISDGQVAFLFKNCFFSKTLKIKAFTKCFFGKLIATLWYYTIFNMETLVVFLIVLQYSLTLKTRTCLKLYLENYAQKETLSLSTNSGSDKVK